MSTYNSILKGLNETVNDEKGELKDVKVNHITISALPHYHGEQIRNIRAKQNMTQQLLASVLGVSKKTVEAWEADKNTPEGPAQRMLELLDKDLTLLEKYMILNRQ